MQKTENRLHLTMNRGERENAVSNCAEIASCDRGERHAHRSGPGAIDLGLPLIGNDDQFADEVLGHEVALRAMEFG